MARRVCYVLMATHLATCQAAKIFDNADSADLVEEARTGTVFTSNGNYFIALNTTYLLFYTALLGLGLFAALSLSSLFTGKETGGYGYSHQGGSGYGHHHRGDQNHDHRQRRFAFSSDSDLASQMYQLAMAFKKYEVTDVECQLFVACEASQVQKEVAEAENVLAEIAEGVRPLMRNIGKHGRKAIAEKDDYVARLVDAFMYGDEVARSNSNKDACEAYRTKCYNNSKKPAY